MQTSIRLTDDSANEITSLFENRTEAIQSAIDSYLAIRKHTLHELKGVFEENELTAMVDNQNGTMLQIEFQANKSMFIAHLEDGETFEDLSGRWDVDFEKFIAKVNSLTSAQVFFLQAEISRYWQLESNTEDSLNIFINRFK